MPSMSRRLATNARPFRYGFYPAVALGFLLFGKPEVWQAVAVAAWCGLWPLAADRLARGGEARRHLRLHLLEVALSSFLFAVCGLSAALLGAVCIILIMSNALQGGPWQALKAVGCGASALAGGLIALPPPAWPDATSMFAGLLLLAYCTLVAHVAFARLMATHGQRAETQALNVRLQQYLPHTLAARLGVADRPRLERRWLVVVFADLVGFTRLVESLQMEELTTMVDAYLACIASVTRRSGGTVSKVVGDGALLVFGEEGTGSHRQLVAQALDCCRRLTGELDRLTANWRDRGLPGAARVKVGMASGYCSLGDWGGGGRLEYTVIGHPVNLASRLQDLAAPGDVLMCERTALLAEVPLGPVERSRLKGLGEVPFHRLLRHDEVSRAN